jgi:hypothetical protein
MPRTRKRNPRGAENVSSNEEYFNASDNPAVNYPNSPLYVLQRRLNALSPLKRNISYNSKLADLERRLNRLTHSPPQALRAESSNPYLEENMYDLEKRLEKLEGKTRGTVVGRRVYTQDASGLFNGLNAPTTVPGENDDFRNSWRRVAGIRNDNAVGVRRFNDAYKEHERKFLANMAANDERRLRRPFNYHRHPITPYMLRMRKLDIKYPKKNKKTKKGKK